MWVLATRQGYFIAGVPWRARQRNYSIDLPENRDPEPVAATKPQERPGEPILVQVQEADTTRPIQSVRVTVFSETCRDLANALTDESGRATLPRVSPADRPKYVLATREGYFLAGLPWDIQKARFRIALPLFYMR